MRLYHGTSPENALGIAAEGIYPNISGAAGAVGCGRPVVYGFVSRQDAIAFCRENCYYPQVVYEIDVDPEACLPDPEAGTEEWAWGDAYMVLTDAPIPARLAYITPGWDLESIAALMDS